MPFKCFVPCHFFFPSAVQRFVVSTVVTFSEGVSCPRSSSRIFGDVLQNHVLFHVIDKCFLIQNEVLYILAEQKAIKENNPWWSHKSAIYVNWFKMKNDETLSQITRIPKDSSNLTSQTNRSCIPTSEFPGFSMPITPPAASTRIMRITVLRCQSEKG